MYQQQSLCVNIRLQVHELKVLRHCLESIHVSVRAALEEGLHHALLRVHEERQSVQGALHIRRVLEVVHLAFRTSTGSKQHGEGDTSNMNKRPSA